MEKELVWKMVQGQIGYDFENLDLLQQAFTRRSYTAENGGENNEVLEFIGDKALDFMVVKLLKMLVLTQSNIYFRFRSSSFG